jgi:hypothetical protein
MNASLKEVKDEIKRNREILKRARETLKQSRQASKPNINKRPKISKEERDA